MIASVLALNAVLALAAPAEAGDLAPVKDAIAKIEAMPAGSDREAVNSAAKAALEAHEGALSQGDGVHYRANLEMLAGRQKESMASYLEHANDPAADPVLAVDSLLTGAFLVERFGDGGKAALELLERLDPAKLTDQQNKRLETMKKGLMIDQLRDGLAGQAVPEIEAVKIMNGPATFDLGAYRGKVVLLDFWATWCPPCRAVIPDLVKLQAERGKDGIQVIGLTRYYGYGMDFAGPDVKLPHGGKRVGDARDPAKMLSEADEDRINESFIEAFEINYPIVFTKVELSRESFGVAGIPTIFVIGKDGKVLGNVVGAGEKSHEMLLALVDQALAAN